MRCLSRCSELGAEIDLFGLAMLGDHLLDVPVDLGGEDEPFTSVSEMVAPALVELLLVCAGAGVDAHESGVRVVLLHAPLQVGGPPDLVATANAQDVDETLVIWGLRATPAFFVVV